MLRFIGEDPETADIGELPTNTKPKKKELGETYLVTKQMFDNGMTPAQIAKERGFVVGTIFGHLARFIEKGELEASQIVEADKYNEILEYFESTFDPTVAIAKDVLGEEFEYGEIKAVLAELQREHFFENQPNEED